MSGKERTLLLGGNSLFDGNQLTSATLGFNLRFGRGAEGVSHDGELPGQFASSKDLNQFDRAIGQTGFSQILKVHPGSVIEPIERIEIDAHVASRVAGVIEAALWHAPDERHLAAFETYANRASRTSRLAFSTATAGLAMAAGFTLAKTLATMLGTGAGFEIV
jgi:hypothetical protein